MSQDDNCCPGSFLFDKSVQLLWPTVAGCLLSYLFTSWLSLVKHSQALLKNPSLHLERFLCRLYNCAVFSLRESMLWIFAYNLMKQRWSYGCKSVPREILVLPDKVFETCRCTWELNWIFIRVSSRTFLHHPIAN